MKDDRLFLYSPTKGIYINPDYTYTEKKETLKQGLEFICNPIRKRNYDMGDGIKAVWYITSSRAMDRIENSFWFMDKPYDTIKKWFGEFGGGVYTFIVFAIIIIPFLILILFGLHRGWCEVQLNKKLMKRCEQYYNGGVK